MNKVYVLYYDIWKGTDYVFQFVCVYDNEELACDAALALQKDYQRSDRLYRVEEVDFEVTIP